MAKKVRKGRNRAVHKRRSRAHSKKGFELSITFLVMLIIAMVIFGSGLFLIKKFFSVTQQVEERVSQQTQKEIERRLIEAGEKVSVPFNRKKLKIGESATFGLGILNTMGSEHIFGLELSFNKAFTLADQEEIFPEQGFINEDWIFTRLENQKLKRNQHIIIPLTISARARMTPPPNPIPTRKDTVYIFNVCVYKDIADEIMKICTKPKPSAFELEKLHGNQIKKLYVEII